MSYNAGAQISDTSFKSFVGILPKVSFFLLFNPNLGGLFRGSF